MSTRPIATEGSWETEPDGFGLRAAAIADLGGAWIDRDVGWLEFNTRVLHEALDERTPLLERVKFLAIFSSNLDEFFMKRMALIRPGAGDDSVAAQELRERLLRTRTMIESMLERQAVVLLRGSSTSVGRARRSPRRLG